MSGQPANDVTDWLAGVDIYLIDQLLKGRFRYGATILEAGCGGGRNLTWFLRSGFAVHAIDTSADAVAQLRGVATHLAPHLPADNFRVEAAEQMSFADSSFDVVLSIAVLHFAKDEARFHAMLSEMWRVLRPGGTFFARLASTIGIENLVQPLGGRRFAVPDGSTRFLVDLEMLLHLTRELNAELLEPIKTVNVQNLRCMTTWVCRKAG
ncbi:MAG: methyltransferase domain-containing protein [Candidatus Sumerlaeaceae bacterium]